MENRTDEVRQLRGCINDLISLLALPAMWGAREPSRILETLQDALLGMLRLDFIYARLHQEAGAQPIEVLRLAQRNPNHQVQGIGREIENCLSGDNLASAFRVANPFGEGEVQIVRFSLGLQEETGQIVAGSQRQDFPTETETLLLRVALNQAAIAMDNARLFEFAQHERAEAEAARQQVANVLESITDSFSVYDREWRVTYFNKEAEKLLPRLGLSREKVLGKNLWELFPDLVNSFVYEQYHRAVAEQVPVEFELFFPPLDGWYEVRAYPSKDGLAVYSQDITKRKQVEGALRRAKEFDEAVMNNMGEGLYTVDDQGRVTFMNPSAERLFGWTLDELRGRRMHDVAHYQYPDGSPFPAEECVGLQVLQQGKSLVNHEDVFIRKDGTLFDVVYSSSPLREGDKITGLVVVLRDVTERKRAEEALRQSEQRYRQLIHALPAAIYACDAEGRVTLYNEAAVALWGREPEVGKDLWWGSWKIFETDGSPLPLEQCPMAVAIQEGRPILGKEIVIERPDGTRRFILPYPDPIRDASGTVIGAVNMLVDLSERKQMEQEREHLLAREQAARADAERRWRESRLLTAATRQFSASLQFEDLLPAICRAAREIANADGATFVLREGEQVHYMEEDAIAPLWKGHRFPISACISGWAILKHQPAIVEDIYADQRLPIEAYQTTFVKSLVMVPVRSHNPLAAIGVYWADKRKAEDREVALLEALADAAHIALINTQLYEQTKAAREQAEEANRLKDEFLATVSHELRTPLNAMLGWTRMLRTNRLDEETIARALETIERNAKSQSQLIEDLLDVSRIISGKMRLDAQPVELAPVIQAAIDSVRPAADAKSIRLQVVLDPLAGPVSGDPTRLQQVVWNLLSNAIKFTPKAGRVQVRLERVNSHLEIIVSDTGIGIRPDFLPYVFDRFRQADSRLTRSQSGLGLGLAIVRHLIELHGGSIEAYSAGEGQGATFTIKLPLLIVRDTERLPAELRERKHPTAWPDVPFECPPALDGLRVLVVDDDADGRQLLTVILERCRAEVTTAASVEAALAILEQFQPDVLLSDIEMPDEDGYSFIRKVRAKEGREKARIPAAALTAHASVSDRMRALSAGFDIHVPKPVEPAELVAVIASLANRSDRRSSS